MSLNNPNLLTNQPTTGFKIKLLVVALSLVVLLPVALAYYYQSRPRPDYLSPLTSPSTMEKKLALQDAVKRDTKTVDLASHIALSQTYLEEAVTRSQNVQQTSVDKRAILQSLNQAITTASQTTNRFPQQPDAWSQLGQVYQAATSVDQAYWTKSQAAYQQALKLDPANVKLLSLLGNSYIQNNQYSNAEIQFTKVAKLDPYNTTNLYWLAASLEKQGRLREATGWLNRLLATESTSSPLYHNTANQLNRLNALLAQAPANSTTTSSQLSRTNPTPTPDSNQTANATPTPATHLSELDLIPEERALADPGYTIAAPQSTAELPDTFSADTTTNALSGQAVLPVGQTELKLTNSYLTPNSQIYLTVDTPGNYSAYVKSISYREGWFIIKLDQPAPIDLKLSWWITD